MGKSYNTVKKPSHYSLASLSLLGGPAVDAQDNSDNLTRLSRAVDDLIAMDLGTLQALTLPGGAFFLDDHIGHMSSNERQNYLEQLDIIQDLRDILTRLDEKYPGVVLTTGVDSDVEGLGIEQACLAFNITGLIGYSRKLFPTPGESNPDNGNPMIVYADDLADPRRFIRLNNGAKAVLNTCYDIYSLGDAQTGSRARLNGICDFKKNESVQTKTDLAAAWHERVRTEAPDLALTAIHYFNTPTVTVFYQRHGIATASAALKGAPSIAAANFLEKLPFQDHQAPLASSNVPAIHLNAASKRAAHHANPTASRYRDTSALRVFQFDV